MLYRQVIVVERVTVYPLKIVSVTSALLRARPRVTLAVVNVKQTPILLMIVTVAVFVVEHVQVIISHLIRL